MRAHRQLIAAAALLVAARAAAATELVVWNSSREDRAALEQLAAAYGARQGTAAQRVTVVTFPFDGLADRISGAIPRGKGPDLFLYPQDRLGGWAEAHLVELLDPYLDAAARDQLIPVTLEAVTHRGGVYALPLGFKVLALYHNRALVPSPPGTTAELAAMARRVTRREAGVYGLAYRYTDYWFHAALQNGFGGGPFDDRLRPVLDSRENLAAMELLLRWRAEFLPVDAVSLAAVEDLFNAGKAGVVLEGPWFRGDVAPGIDWGVAPLPRISEAGGRPMRPWMTVDGLYVSARSSQKAGAFAFARWLCEVDASRTLALRGTLVPANQKAYLDPQVLANPALPVFMKQARVAVAMPNAPEMTLMWAPATAALGAVALGDLPPAVALGRAQARLARAIAELHGPAAP